MELICGAVIILFEDNSINIIELGIKIVTLIQNLSSKNIMDCK